MKGYFCNHLPPAKDEDLYKLVHTSVREGSNTKYRIWATPRGNLFVTSEKWKCGQLFILPPFPDNDTVKAAVCKIEKWLDQFPTPSESAITLDLTEHPWQREEL